MKNNGKVSFGYIRRVFAGALMGAAALVGAAAHAEVNIEDIYAVCTPNNGQTSDEKEQTLHNGVIRIVLTLSGEITAVNGTPYILLNNMKNFASSTPGQQFRAESGPTLFEGRDLYFDYPIQPGDYSSGVDLQSLSLNGAVISVQTSSGSENLSTLPLPSLRNDYDYVIQVSTFYFWPEGGSPTNTVVVPSKKAKVGSKFSAPDSIVYSGVSPLNSEVPFDVLVMSDDESASFTISQGNYSGNVEVGSDPYVVTMPTTGSMTIGVTPTMATEAGERVRIRLRPQAANGAADADLYVVYENGIEDEVVSIERISVASATNTVYGKSANMMAILIQVDFTEKIYDVPSSSSPRLKLNVLNANSANNYATFYKEIPYKNKKQLSFIYEIKPGDYIDRLDLATSMGLSNFDDVVFGTQTKQIPFDFEAPQGRDNPKALGHDDNGRVGIQTIIFDSNDEPAYEFSIEEGQLYELVVKRGGLAQQSQGFTLTSVGTNGVSMSNGDRITWSTPFSIGGNTDRATLNITAEEAGTQILRLHPSGYVGADGDLVATVHVTPGSTPPRVQLSSVSKVDEGDADFEAILSLSKMPKAPVTVTVESSNPDSLEIRSITGLASATMRNGKAEVMFPANSPVTTTCTIRLTPRDGLESGGVTLTASATNSNYATAELPILVNNKKPALAESMFNEDNKWLISGFTEMTESSISWTVLDAQADLNAGLTATLDFGDGDHTNIVCHGSGSVRHTYKEAKGDLESNRDGYTITLVLEDKDHGVSELYEGMVYVKPSITALIQERKREEGNGGGISYTSENTQETLTGLGEGSIVDSKGTARKVLTEGRTYAWSSYYPGGGAILFQGIPKTFTDVHRAAGTNATFNSYFHVWVGEVFSDEAATDPTKSADSARVDADNDTLSFTVGGVFSREYYPEDNYADIDFDKLPDSWEQAVWPGEYAFEKVGGSEDAPYGTKDNPDGDFLPACVAGINPDGSFKVQGRNFLANGPDFVNEYEVRGTHWALNAAGSDPVAEYLDEPHAGSYADAVGGWAFTDGGSVKYKGFYGTDPKNADTDADGLTDGWEYFFWRQAKFPPKDENGEELPTGWRYDPTKVIEGVPIDNAEIVATFNPCVADGHYSLDTDGDGLSNFEEFLLGTNPVHWDTDGDGMNDGWETMWGLEPTDPGDASKNPDGDFMAYALLDNPSTGETNVLMHAEVFNAFGFDPRTAWTGQYHERNRSKGKAAPNTIPFSNYYEHQLARWAIDQGFVTEVEPMSRKWMTQPVPYGAPRYISPSWRKTANRVNVPGHALKPTDTAVGDSEEGGPYAVPFGNLAFTVSPTEVKTHGCDSDSDGMPDGWELYLCRSEAEPRNRRDGLWPTSAPTTPANGAEDDGTQDYESAKDAKSTFDSDGLTALQECHSTELCDYYGSICTNGVQKFVNVNIAKEDNEASDKKRWYNKWWPSNPFDGDTDSDGLPDNLEGDEKFFYQDYYAPAWNGDHTKYGIEWQLAERFGETTMRRGHVPGGGLNPCSVDTDMDYIPDGWEWVYHGENRDLDWEGGFCNEPGKESSLSVRNGGIVFWIGGAGMDGTYFDSRVCIDECEGPLASVSNKVNYVIKDGRTYRDFDFDHDGLDNYQEYLVNGVRHFQYDKWEAGLGYGGYDIQEIFDTGKFHVLGEGLTNGETVAISSFDDWSSDGRTPKLKTVDDLFLYWDWARYADDWQSPGGDRPVKLGDLLRAEGVPDALLDMVEGVKDGAYPFTYMPLESRSGSLSYASTDPRLADSDGDNMDDYYELFHGLNPILSDVLDYCGKDNPALGADDAYDFRKHPWMVGMPNADPDYDDKPNWEEALSPGQLAPANHNTDPSPLWMTDMSYSNSFVNLYYNWGSAANFWTIDGGDNTIYRGYPYPDDMYLREVMGEVLTDPRPSYIFSFECNEGFDTDNDNISDPYEINGSAGSTTDPLNPDRPMKRKALYLDGESAARTRSLCAFGPNALRSFTIEAWVKPEEPAMGRRQIILERPVAWDDGNLAAIADALNPPQVRRNFCLGLTETGRPFVEFDNGGKDLITEGAEASAGVALEANRWYHLAAVRDGFANSLALYVDGVRIASKSTAAIPYTGFTASSINPVGDQEYIRPIWAPIVVGAADLNATASAKVDGSAVFRNGFVEPISGGDPVLANGFKGWIDEVRIWDGARPAGDDVDDPRVRKWGWPTISGDAKDLKRYGLNEVLAAQNDAIKYMQRIFDYRHNRMDEEQGLFQFGSLTNNYWSFRASGMTFQEFRAAISEYIQMTGGEDPIVRIPPTLLCAYSFDTLPDPDNDYEGRQPLNLEKALNDRPADYADGTPWLAGAPDRTTVYTTPDAPYQFPQYIQNWVTWLPLAHIVSNGYDTGYAEIRDDGKSDYPLYVLRADSVANSKYWTRDAKGGVPLSELNEFANWQGGTVGGASTNFNGGLFNSFPNSANPYGYRYETGLTVSDEVNPVSSLPDAYDPYYAVLFNDLLPLRGAVADSDVQLWDDPNGDSVGVHRDTDGDGLPDDFELACGLDLDNADQNGNGVLDAYDDFDGDGIFNQGEYRAGLNPMSADSDGDGIADYYDNSPEGLTYGELYSDNDHVLDAYEERWDAAFASPFRYDEHLDRDGDGWDNWSEALAGTRLSPTADGEMNTFPMPSLTVTLDYQGESLSGRLIVHAYTDSEMNGWPDAVLATTNLTIGAGLLPMTITLTQDNVIFGHLRQGANWFYAWIDQDTTANASSVNGGNWPTWTPDEPAAVADYQAMGGIGIGWDYNPVTFHLSKEALGYVRFNFASGNADVQRFATDGQRHQVSLKIANTFFSKTLEWPRTWLHEGDLQAGRTQNYGVTEGGFDEYGSNPTIYEVFVDNVYGGVYTNWYRAGSLPTPTLLSPDGQGVVYEARPEFRFVLPAEATEFELAIWDHGTPVYSARIPAPMVAAGTPTGWKLPASVALAAGTTYTWTVTPYNVNNQYARFGGSGTAVGNFRMASALEQNARPMSYSAKVAVDYPTGWAYKNGQTPRILVGAFRSASFNDSPDSLVTANAAGEVTLVGLLFGERYFLMAFIDQNGNGKRDSWESWGYYRAASSLTPFAPAAISATSAETVPTYKIVLSDSDTDNDLMPDSIEYVLYGGSHPSDFLAQTGLDSASLFSFRSTASAATLASALATASGDADGDGISDAEELFVRRTNAANSDTDGDGIDDGDEEALFGSSADAANTAQTLRVTSISLDEDGNVTFTWGWDGAPTSGAKRGATTMETTVEPADAAPSGGMMRAAATAPITGLRYVIEANDSLTNPDGWFEVKRVDALTGEASGGTLPESATGAMFFRVVLEK